MNTTNTKTKLTLETLTLEDLDRFPTANAMLDELYGKEGTQTREAFNREADAYYEKHYCNNGCGKKEQNETVRENILVSEEK